MCPRSSYCPANSANPTACPAATPYAFVGSSSLAACSVSPVVTTLAGGNGGTTSGSANGQGTFATFNNPIGVAVDASGRVFVADSQNNLIRIVNISTGAVHTLAGGNSGTQPGSANGQGSAATFRKPTGVAADASGNLYVADFDNNLIRV